MTTTTDRACVLVMLLAAWSCSARTPAVRVPPQIDLKPHEVIGVIEFGSTANGELGPLATRRFTEAARRDQGLVRIVDLGSKNEALRSIGRDDLDPGALVELGRKHGVRTIIVGNVMVSGVKPNISFDAAFHSGGLSANVDATLAVQIVETDSGASLWNRSARATHSVANLSVWGGKNFVFDAADPEQAYGGLVDQLVEQVTRPFRASWAR